MIKIAKLLVSDLRIRSVPGAVATGSTLQQLSRLLNCYPVATAPVT